uniref:CSON006191 protein n=1 Tax=Culicoides sonorensis TaxID=179676 RepID=A0A336LZJ1_CULSO
MVTNNLNEVEQNEKLLAKSRNLSIHSRSGMQIKLEKQNKQIFQRCTTQIVRRIYILNWITSYNSNFFISDLIAGITLGLTIIPQAIAYAALAGLSSEYGLYAAFIGAFIYVVFGSVKQVSIGPTSLMALLVLPLTAGKPIEYVFVLAFIAGCIELLLGICKMGFIVDLIPIPVTNAFTSATSLVIIASQLKSVTGLKYLGTSFSTYIYGFFSHITDVKLGDSILGLCCCTTLLLLRKLQDIPISEQNPYRAVIKKTLWYITISRNALVVAITSVIAFIWSNGGATQVPFKLSGKVKSGIPAFGLPDFSVDQGNGTVITFTDILSDFGIGIIFVPLVAILANVSIAKAFSTGKIVDASQEMIALGLCNIFGSFFQSMPTCGAFTRSAVSEASGIRTPLAGIYSGTMTLLALSFLTPYFYFIPRATLGSVLICAVYFMIDQNLPPKLWKENRKDFYSWLSCFVICMLFGVEIGLLFGIFSNICVLTFQWMRPRIKATLDTYEGVQFVKITPTLGLLYPGVDYLRGFINKIAIEYCYVNYIMIDSSKIVSLDYTAIKGFENIVIDAKSRDQEVIFYNLSSGLHDQLGQVKKNSYCCDTKDELQRLLLTHKNDVARKDSEAQQKNCSIDISPIGENPTVAPDKNE